MKKRFLIFSLILCVALLFGSVSVMAADITAPLGVGISSVTPAGENDLPKGAFYDVAERDWYFNFVRFASLNDIFTGYPDQTFAPNKAMTRAEVVRVLFTLDGAPDIAAGNRFSDVPAGEWYAEEVEWAASIGVISGYPDGTFKPQLEVSRQDFVTMLYRYANYKEYNTEGRAELTFPDAGQVNDYALESFAWAIDAGVINGTVEADGVYLRPTASTTRAQVAKMLSVFATEYMDMGKLDELRFVNRRSYLTLGRSARLDGRLGVHPETAYQEYTWTSSDESVITVSRGIVTGVSLGTATITCTSFDGKSDSVTITVTENPIYPAMDVADFLELNGDGFYGGGHPAGGMSWYYMGIDGDWEYLYGLAIDDYSSLYMVSRAYNIKESYGYQVEADLDHGNYSTFWFWDDTTGEMLTGQGHQWDPELITENTDFTLMNLRDSSFNDYNPAEGFDDIYSAEMHFIIGQLDSILADMGFEFNKWSLGFVKY